MLSGLYAWRYRAKQSMSGTLLSALPHLPLPIILLVFIVSLLITVGSSAWFTKSLETISDFFDLSPSLLSLLGALGANIPNYIASIIAIASSQFAVGLGIIIGSNIYNIAIILSISTFATPSLHGIALKPKAAQDVLVVARYTLAIMLTTWLAIWLLSTTDPATMPRPPLLVTISAIINNLLTLSIFGALSIHALRHVHDHTVVETTSPELSGTSPDSQGSISQNRTRLLSGIRYMGQALLALVISLGGVIVMVESGQDFAIKVNLPQVILGLIILAVATSLPNTVVAFSLARTHRAVTCIEEVFSSNSINAALGIALPLLFWRGALHDPWLLWLDTPLMLALNAFVLLCILRQRISRSVAVLLLFVYVVWVVVHIL